jgi:hypothetical protein
MLVNEGEIVTRALHAYFTVANRAGLNADQPSLKLCGMEDIGDKTYIVLRNSYRTLAVYRLRNDNMLKRLKRWPAELNNE